MAKVSIYIRTYKRDIAWLDLCLQSIHQNLQGWDEIVVGVPEGQIDHLRYLATERRIVCPYFLMDYVGQQVAKLQAHRYVRGEFVLFVDSDVIFLPGAKVSDFFVDGLPSVEKRRYVALQKDGMAATKWQQAVENLYGENPEWEFMQGHGTRLYRVSTLRDFSDKFPTIETYARHVPKRLFSEFNLLGYYAWRYEHDRYAFRDIDTTPARIPASKQFWTVDGLTPATLTELATLGFRPRWPSTLSPLDRAKQWLSQSTRHTKQWLNTFRKPTP
jgi:glycosyltransferase involved in cell wall biosynthesis